MAGLFGKEGFTMKPVLVMLVAVLLFVHTADAIVCSDPDGFDIYNKGSTTGQESFVLQDFCIGNSVSEASCLNNKQVYVQFECSSGCSDGACAYPQIQASCEQMPNSATVNGKEYINKCVKSHPDALFEDVVVTYACSENRMGSNAVYCGDQICADNGVAKCVDPGSAQLVSLGGNPESIIPEDFVCSDYGQFVELGGIEYQDSCDNFDSESRIMATAIDYSCDGNQLEKSVLECGSGNECFRGQCVEAQSGLNGGYVIGDSSGFVNLISVIVFLIVAALVFFYFYIRR